MQQIRLRELEDQCIQECQPPCTAVCPVHVDIRGLTSAITNSDFQAAKKILQRAVPFPEIIARTCDQPCQTQCYRGSTGGAIEIAALELACVQHAQESHFIPLIRSKKNARVAVVGSGLSSLTVAYDLSTKGYQVTLFEVDIQLGGRLLQYTESQLPRSVIERETYVIRKTGVDVRLNMLLDHKFVAENPFDAWFLGGELSRSAPFDLTCDDLGNIILDTQTFQTSQTNVFATRDISSTVLAISDGRRAAISIDRFLQNVSLTASRNNEGAYQTRLVTNTSKVEPVDRLSPHKNGNAYSKDEATIEARRCLQCDCMECVKVCEYLKHYGSYPKKYIREVYNNLSIIMRARTANTMINSCTLCGLCGEVCPTDLDMGSVIQEARQTMVQTSKMPISAHDFALRDMEFSNSDHASLSLAPNQKQTCQYLFFPGCQLSASNPEYIPEIYQTLTSILPEVGVMQRCCGAPADWAGEKGLFEQTISKFKSQWVDFGSPRLVLACSSCQRVFRTQLPEIETTSIWEIFAQYQLFPTDVKYGRPLAVHDPCSSRHETGWQDAIRTGLFTMQIDFHELEMSRNLTECCGYGGVAWLANRELVKDILRRRAGEDEADYLTYCVMCRDLLAGAGKPSLHMLDLMYGKNLEKKAMQRGPDYSQRHENRIRAKQKMLKVLSGKDHNPMESHEKYPLLLDPEIRSVLENRLILVEDVQKVIEHAETSSEKFFNQENNHILASFKPNLITYWVEYTKVNEEYRIYDAYSHRMMLEGGKK